MDNDLDNYLAYVRRIIPEAARREMTTQEGYEARPVLPVLVQPTDAGGFIGKAFQLLQVLIDHGRDKDAFHALVLLKSAIRVPYARMRDDKLAEHHALLDKALRAFVAKCPTDEGADAKFDCRENFVRMMVNGLRWHQQRDTGKRHTWYWDFAAAKQRHLNNAYFRKWCRDRMLDNNVEYDEESNCCFHSVSLDLLDWLQTKAWPEIRYNVFCTAGSKLPTELTERIFEYALEAEEIDKDPRLTCYETGGPSEVVEMKCDHLRYIDPEKHLRKFRKAESCCRVIDRDIMKGDHCVDLEELTGQLYLRVSKSLQIKASKSAPNSSSNQFNSSH